MEELKFWNLATSPPFEKTDKKTMIEPIIFSYQESQICVLHNTYTSEELLHQFDYPDKYIHEMSKLQNEHRKREFLGLRLALKYCCNGVEKAILHTSTGKPFVEDNRVKISFSHSREWIAVMIHPLMEVGVDIEQPTEKLKNIADRFLGKEEKSDFKTADNLDYLRIIWSAKEALYKIIGNDAYNFSAKLRVFPFNLKQNGELKVVYTDTGKIFEVHYMLNKEFTLAYCIDNE